MVEPTQDKDRRSFSENFESVLVQLGINAETLVGVFYSGLAFWFSLKLISKFHQNDMLDAMRGG